MRRLWTDTRLADYVREELGFPGARQAAMVEKLSVEIETGEVSRQPWYLLTSLPPDDAAPMNCSVCSAIIGVSRTACIM